MCGIAAIFHFDGAPVDIAELTAMCSAMAHRGPDGAGYALLGDQQVALGHVRLSIVDLMGGVQPLFNEDKSIAVTCNGEIYDYGVHRRSLEDDGHVFRTNSDSELIVHLYERRGLECLGELNGEFAFVLWDGRQRLLLAARDRAGVKPLYYTRRGNGLVLGSEVKAILALPDVERSLAPDYFSGAGLGVVPSNTSAFARIHCLRPGHYLIAREDGIRKECPYHRWAFDADPSMGFEEAVERVRAAMSTSVRRRLQADVSVHCYLSGGIDSSIVCGLMSEQLQSFSAYHVSFPDTAFDESTQAREIAQHFGASLEVVECRSESMAAHLVKTVEHVELPLANCNAVGKFMLSSLVRSREHKVCLTGEGADEVFGGYPYFKLEALWHAAREQRLSRAEYRSLWRDFQAREQRSLGTVWHKSNAWRNGHNPYGFPSYLHIRAKESGSMAPFLFEGAPAKDQLENRFLAEFPPDDLAGLDPFNATRTVALSTLAGNLIPLLGDRVEMAHSIECRTPFLDPELMALSTKIPPAHFLDLSALREKRILHEAFGDKLPAVVRNGHKHPFMAPQWRTVLASPAGRELMREYLGPERTRRAGIYRPRAVNILRTLWLHAPASSMFVRRLDPLMGIVLTAHVLHDRFVEKAPQPVTKIVLQNLSPSPS